MRKIKPNPACAFTTLLNLHLYTIQFEAGPRNIPNPPLTLNTVDNSCTAHATKHDKTLFFSPEQPPLDEAKYPLNQGILLPRAKGRLQYPMPVHLASSKTVHKDTGKGGGRRGVGMNRLTMNTRAPLGFKICSL